MIEIFQLFLVDKQWYRACVTSIKDSKIRVRFIDYGNEEFINSQDWHPLDKQFINLPQFSVKCSLTGTVLVLNVTICCFFLSC